MTLLKSNDISGISENLYKYNKSMFNKLGKSLAEVAMYAVNWEKGSYEDYIKNDLIAIVPITSGNGIIDGFSETIKNIIEITGFKAFVTDNSDVQGLEEAYKRRVKIIFIADDDKFIAINTCNYNIADNSFNTGRGYAAALDLMSGGLRDRTVVLIGAGSVGIGAASFMTAHGAKVLVYDILRQKAERLRDLFPEVEILTEFHSALKNNNLIFDATPAKNIIMKEYISESTLISAPGIPLGLEKDCMPIIKDRLIHDVLELGVVTMLFHALS